MAVRTTWQSDGILRTSDGTIGVILFSLAGTEDPPLVRGCAPLVGRLCDVIN